MRIRSALLAAVGLPCLTACLMQPFKPEHGYPADWPAFRDLAPGCTDLDGIYRNAGIAKPPDSTDLVPIELAALIPRDNKVDAVADLTGKPLPDDTVRLRMMPARSKFSSPYTLASITIGGKTETYEIESVCDEKGLVYVLAETAAGFVVWFGGDQDRVFMTRGADGSLIVMVHSEVGGLILVVPYYRADYSWARFEPVPD